MSRIISTGRDSWTAQYRPSRRDHREVIQPMDSNTFRRGLGWFPMAVLILAPLPFAIHLIAAAF